MPDITCNVNQCTHKSKSSTIMNKHCTSQVQVKLTHNLILFSNLQSFPINNVPTKWVFKIMNRLRASEILEMVVMSRKGILEHYNCFVLCCMKRESRTNTITMKQLQKKLHKSDTVYDVYSSFNRNKKLPKNKNKNPWVFYYIIKTHYKSKFSYLYLKQHERALSVSIQILI